MANAKFRVLLVDDFDGWRRYCKTKFEQKTDLQVVGEASDGLEAVRKAQQLQPDVILLDIGLPTLNGIEAARRILLHAPQTKILFASEQRSSDIAEEALATGARGYLLKSQAESELWPALEAVLQGKQFVSANLTDPALGHPERRLSHVEPAPHHGVGFYSDEIQLLDAVTEFIGAALKAGNAAVVVASESHRNSFLPRLQAQGVDIRIAIEQGRYIALDAGEALPNFMRRGMPDSVLFLKLLTDLIRTTAKAAARENPRVAIYGEMCHLLWAQGEAEAAIQVEKLGNQLARTHDVDIFCAYSLNRVEGGMDPSVFQGICAEHSAVYSLIRVKRSGSPSDLLPLL